MGNFPTSIGEKKGNPGIKRSVRHDKLPYDLNRDFVPVTLAVAVPELLVVHPSLPTRTAKELVALAKAKPGQITYGWHAQSSFHLDSNGSAERVISQRLLRWAACCPKAGWQPLHGPRCGR
jgi:tripartite tricarboxylate transporter family receptor